MCWKFVMNLILLINTANENYKTKSSSKIPASTVCYIFDKLAIWCVDLYCVKWWTKTNDEHFFQVLTNMNTQVTAADFPYSNSCPKNTEKWQNLVEKKRKVPKKRARWRKKQKRPQCHRTFQPVKLMLKWTHRIPTKARKRSCNWSINVMYTFKRIIYF